MTAIDRLAEYLSGADPSDRQFAGPAAASFHDEIVREERDRIRRELRKLRDEAVDIRRRIPGRPDYLTAEYLTGYSDALGDLIDDLAPQG